MFDLLAQLVLRKWIILAVTGIAMVLGILIGFLLPVQYQATAAIMPPQESQPAASVLNQLAFQGLAMGGGALGLKNPNEIYLGILNSRPIADAIIRRFALMQAYHAADMTGARMALANNTDIVSEKSGLIRISVTSTDKKQAADIANAFVDELRNLTQNLSVTEASRRSLFYEQQIRRANEALVQAEASLETVQRGNGMVQPDAQARSMIERLESLRSTIAAKRVEVESLRSYSTEKNPDVQLAERQLASLQAELGSLTQRNHTPNSANVTLADVPSAGVEFLRAQHELQYRQAMLDLLMKQYDAAKLDEGKEAAIIQVVEPAIAPERKASPHRARIVLGMGLLGLILAALYVIAEAAVAHWREDGDLWSRWEMCWIFLKRPPRFRPRRS